MATPKEVRFSDDARQGLLRCVNVLANAVNVTLGPRVRNVVLETVLSSVESETLTPARRSAARGCSASDATIPACTLEVGQRSRVTPRSRTAAIKDGSSAVVAPWAMRRRKPSYGWS